MNNYQQEELMYIYNNPQTRFYDEDDNSSIEGELIQVNQHLEPEQYKYEFPTKMSLKELSLFLDNEHTIDCFFDESSFTSVTALSTDKQYFNGDHHMNSSSSSSLWHETLVEEEEEEDEYIQDFKLSPLQLPAQVVYNTFQPTTIKDQEQRPVGPSSFLSDTMYNKHAVTQQQQQQQQPKYLHTGYSCLSFSDDSHASIPIMDTDNDSSTDSSSLRSTELRTVLIKLSKKNISILHDEGYDDNLDDELESHCIFYSLNNNEETIDNEYQRDKAAIKIQSLWRGYQSRKSNNLTKTMLNLTKISNHFNTKQFLKLEEKLREETAMRMAFEKAMEDMTVLMDQQQKILYDRLEQEVHMRQLYENKMNQALKQLQPLESRLKKEVTARYKMEEMMTRVLDQMHESETSRQQQAKEDAEYKKSMQLKLDQALEEISSIKSSSAAVKSTNNRKYNPSSTTTTKNTSAVTTKSRPTTNASNTTTTTSVRKSIVPGTKNTATTTTLRRQQQQQQQPQRISSTANQPKSPLYERPSVIPSNRRPLTSSTTKRIQPTTNTTTPPRRPLLTRK